MQSKYSEILEFVNLNTTTYLGNKDRNVILGENASVIKFLKEKLTELRIFTQKYTFESQLEEINFFKHQKPTLVGRLMFYYKVFHIESKCPPCAEHWDEYYMNRQLELKLFFDRHVSFYQYYKSGTTHLDNHYFLRGKKEICHEVETYDFDQFPDFTTGYDNLAAHILSTEMIYAYLTTKRQALTNANGGGPNPSRDHLWTGKMVELVELIYALHTRKCINNGKIKIEELSDYMGLVFGVDIKDCYRSYIDIKRRKADSRTYFLDELGQQLNERMDEEEK